MSVISGRPPKELSERLKIFFPLFFTTPEGEKELEKLKTKQEPEVMR